jgi:pectate lyase
MAALASSPDGSQVVPELSPQRRMTPFLRIVAALLSFAALSASAGVLLDDTWADGNRTGTALPTDSAWYASSAASLTAAPGAMTGLTGGGSSRSWWTHFTTDPAAPVSLAVGDTLKVTLAFTPTGVNTGNSGRSLRIGLYDYSAGTRRTTDGGSPDGTSVTGYMLNLNFAPTFGTSSPLQIQARTKPADNDLMGSSGDYTTIDSGGVSGGAGFVEGTPYRLEFSVTRNAGSVTITTAFFDDIGLVVSAAATDTNTPTTRFDAFALRPANTTGTATSFAFTRFKVETASVPVPPLIQTQPLDASVTAGLDTAFSVEAEGTKPLAYQWYFNGTTALANATNSSLALTNVVPAQMGGYSVAVRNPSGSVTSRIAQLTVNTPVSPTITGDPQSKTITAGQSATFTVAASGSAPLVFQWFKGALPIAQATNASFTLSFTQTTDAGDYRAVVANSAGSATSRVATLTVNLPTATERDFRLTGFAGLDGSATNGTLRAGGTTGGAGGAHVIATTAADLVRYLETNATLMVELVNDIDLSSLANHSGGFPANYPVGEILVRSHKTVYSKNGSAIRRGSMRIGKPSLGAQQNIVFRNLKFRDLWVYDPSGNYDSYGWDYIVVGDGSHHVWVDHCDFDSSYDGNVDVVHGSDLVTVSWCVFRNQKKCNLVGHSDSNAAEDTGHLNVTFHHNWYVNVAERMPRMRFGNAHVFNLYCENLGAYTSSNNAAGAKAIQSTANAAVLVENSWFERALAGSYPTIEQNGGPTGTVKVVNCVLTNSPGANPFRQFGQASFTFNAPFASAVPPYPYTLTAVTNVPNLVTNCAGVGKVGFELWQMERFNLAQLADPAISGPDATPAHDGVSNFAKYALLLDPFTPVASPLTPFRIEDSNGVLTYSRPETATDVTYRVLVSDDLLVWSETNIVQTLLPTDAVGIETWEARYTGPATPNRYFRLKVER